jgi:hypothetical protein
LKEALPQDVSSDESQSDVERIQDPKSRVGTSPSALESDSSDYHYHPAEAGSDND